MAAKYRHYNQVIGNADFIRIIESALISVDIKELKAKKNREKSYYVADIIRSFLNMHNVTADLKTEHAFINGQKDAIDIYIGYKDLALMIEIDNLRADQVAKKVLSRTSAFPGNDIAYITFCYDSKSDRRHKDECLKYIDTHFKNYFDNHTRIEYLAFIPSEYIK